MDAGFRIIVNRLRASLIRQERLHKRENQYGDDDDQEENGDFIMEKCAESRSPVGVVGIAAALGVFFIGGCFREELFLGKVFVLLIGRKLLLQI